MRIAAVADVHSPRYLSEFKKALERCENPDIFLLAGDMVDSGKIEEYEQILDAIVDQFGTEVPIVACFGNSEKGVSLQTIQDIVGEGITFLDGDTFVMSHNDRKLGVLGVPILDVTRNLQERSLEEIFEKKIRQLSQHLRDLKRICDQSVLLLHYSPLSGEEFPEAFSWWVSSVFREVQPNLVIHGHIHWATKSETRIGDIRVFNVAFPSTNKITEIHSV